MEEFELIRSYRKTISVQVKRDGGFLVRAPYHCPICVIEEFLGQKKKILNRYRDQILSMPPIPVVTRAEVALLKAAAERKIFPKVAEWSQRTGLSYDGVKITSARQRFGSCSATNHLCFSVFLAMASEEEIDYVVLHELCHTVEHNHSSRFYALVSQFMPDWKNREKNLRKIIIPEIAE